MATIQILKYFKDTTSVGLWYPSHSSINLVGYFLILQGASWIEKAQVARVIFLEQASYLGIKQACVVALSTTEAEYIVVGSCCAQILWIKKQLEDFGLKVNNVLSTSLKNKFSIKGQSTLRFATTL